MLDALDIRMDALATQYDSIGSLFADKLKAALAGQVEDNTQRVKMKGKQAATVLLDHKKFLILTGAGISAASGIPTFRGQEGLWKQKKSYAGECEPTDVLKL